MAEQILPNIYRINVPLPQNPLKTLNAYLLTGSRNLLIDTGFNRPECEAALRAAFRELEIDLERTDIFITHSHSDHCGLAGAFHSSNSRIYCSETDGKIINRAIGAEYWEELDRVFLQYGLPKRESGANTEAHPGRQYNNGQIISFTHVKDGDILHVGNYELECIYTPGHTPGHMCLYDRKQKLLFSGDHILGDITPNICMEVEDQNPLKAYLANLRKVQQLEVEHIFTAHRGMSMDMYTRIRELEAHHEYRLREAEKILQQKDVTGYEAAAEMTWKISCKTWADFPEPQKWFATGEALAHLMYLTGEGRAERYLKNGIFYFRKAE